MGLAYIGPVPLTLYDPKFGMSAGASTAGFRQGGFSGEVEWKEAQQLSELLANPGRRLTVQGITGVLEYVYSDDDMLRVWNGWYLLGQVQLQPEHEHSLGGLARPIPFSLDATYIGDQRQVLIGRSERARTNGYSLAPKSIVVDPFWSESAAGEEFVVSPGGSFITREYDNSPHDTNGTPSARAVGINVGSLGALSSVAVPHRKYATDYDGQSTPRWVSDRASDVRAFDRRLDREVYGPSHPFLLASDILVTNGLLRFWVGAEGIHPYIHVQVFRSGSWREVGNLCFEGDAATDVLLGARLSYVTSEEARVVLTVRRLGDISISLKRGERMFRIRHGSTRAPTANLQRIVRWRGHPSPFHASAATSDTGKFGNGIAIASGDITFNWPTVVPKSEWSYCGWWLPETTSLLQSSSGLLTISDTAGPVSTVLFNGTTKSIDWTQNGQTISSGLLSLAWLAADTPVFWCIRHSSTAGRVLTTYVQGGSVAHVANPAYTNPGTSDANYRAHVVGLVSTNFFGFSTYGGAAFGSGTQANGVLDTYKLYDAYLTNAEAASLATATSALGGGPTNEGALVFYAPFDATPDPLGSTLSGGRRHQVDGGGSRLAVDGLTKGLGLLSASASSAPGLAVSQTATYVDVAAYLATTASGDDLDDYHQQFAADTQQRILVR